MPDAGLLRVSLHTDDVHVDLALPGGLPVAALLPSIADILATQGGHRDERLAMQYQLSRPGESALDVSKTLAQHKVRDGTVLFLTGTSDELPAPSFDDAAEAVATSLAAVTRPWTRRTAGLTGALTAIWLAGVGALTVARTVFTVSNVRHHGAVGSIVAAGCAALLAAVVAERGFHDRLAALTLSLLATGSIALAGLITVPGSPGAPNALLAAAGTAVTAVVVMHVLDCGSILFRAIAWLAAFAAVAALVAAATPLPLRAVGAMSAVISLALLEASARLSVLLAGLAPRLHGDDEPPDALPARAIQADSWLTSLVVAFATSAAFGGIGVALTAYRTAGPGVVGIVFATLTGALLLARARTQYNAVRMGALTATGTGVLSATFVALATTYATHVGWVVVGAAMLPAAPLCVKLLAPMVKLSPVAQRGLELTEWLALASLAPLASWICGFYGLARGLHLP